MRIQIVRKVRKLTAAANAQGPWPEDRPDGFYTRNFYQPPANPEGTERKDAEPSER